MNLHILKENFDKFLQQENDLIDEGFFRNILNKGQGWFNKSILQPLKVKYQQQLQPVFKALEDLKVKNPNATKEQIKVVVDSAMKNVNLEQVTSQIIKEAMNVNDKGFSKRKQYLMSAIVTIMLGAKIISLFAGLAGQDAYDAVKDSVKTSTGIEYKLDSDPTQVFKSGQVDGDAWKIVQQMSGAVDDTQDTGESQPTDPRILQAMDALQGTSMEKYANDLNNPTKFLNDLTTDANYYNQFKADYTEYSKTNSGNADNFMQLVSTSIKVLAGPGNILNWFDGNGERISGTSAEFSQWKTENPSDSTNTTATSQVANQEMRSINRIIQQTAAAIDR